MEKDEWRKCVDYEEFYEVSNFGVVKSIRNKIILRPYINKYGYVKVAFSTNGKLEQKSVHRLVAQAFIPNRENKPEVNHKNYIKIDNRVQNLEWVTRIENQRYSRTVISTEDKKVKREEWLKNRIKKNPNYYKENYQKYQKGRILSEKQKQRMREYSRSRRIIKKEEN